MNAPLTINTMRTLPDGQMITENGVYDLSMKTYHSQCFSAPSISSSGLRTIWNDSPAHYWHQSDFNPNPPESKDRPHFTLGRAAHHLLFLGRSGFEEEFVLRPEKFKDYRSNEAKSWRDEAVASGKTIITDTELEHITGMAKSLAAHPLVKAGILDGAVERSLIFKDKETGVWLKSRPDNLLGSSWDVSDLKTTTSVSTHCLQRTIAENGYAIQGALVGMAIRELFNQEMNSFSLVFVEKTPPYCARVVSITPEDLERGERQIRAATRIFAQCLETGIWPGPGGQQQDAHYMPMPDWATRQIENRLDVTGEAA